MPQLDLLTFFTQFFWGILSLFLFYAFVSKYIIPELTRVLKYRAKASLSSTSQGSVDLMALKDSGDASDDFSHFSEKAGARNIYDDGTYKSIRVLLKARKKRDTFLTRILSRAASTSAQLPVQKPRESFVEDSSVAAKSKVSPKDTSPKKTKHKKSNSKKAAKISPEKDAKDNLKKSK